MGADFRPQQVESVFHKSGNAIIGAPTGGAEADRSCDSRQTLGSAGLQIPSSANGPYSTSSSSWEVSGARLSSQTSPS